MSGAFVWAWQRQEGATAVEYALMAALIAMVIFGAVTMLGRNLGDSYDCTADHVEMLTQDDAATC